MADHGFARGLTNYGDRDFALYLRRSFARSMGLSREMLARPIVGIAATQSGFNNCHRTAGELVDAVSRGVLAAGALPRPFPTTSLGEVFLNPTSMVYRNLMAMDTEEMVRAQPMDAVVLVGGCDKTVPAQLMGAVSADVPAVQLVVGPMMTGRYRGERLGACTDCRRFWAKYRAGEIGAEEIEDVEARLATTAGTCAVMGTASTMAIVAEVLGLALPGTAGIPAVHADRLVARRGRKSGRLAALLVRAPPSGPSEPRHGGVGGERAACPPWPSRASTNASWGIWLSGGTAGDPHPPRPPQRDLGRDAGPRGPQSPSASGYMREDFHAGRGGVGAVLREAEAASSHSRDARRHGADAGGTASPERRTGWTGPSSVRSPDPVSPVGGLVALSGALAPDGAIFKRGRRDAGPLRARGAGGGVRRPTTTSGADRRPRPRTDARRRPRTEGGWPGGGRMPEAATCRSRKKLARAGVKGHGAHLRPRIVGQRPFGTIVLPCGRRRPPWEGALAARASGDRIRLSVSAKTIRPPWFRRRRSPNSLHRLRAKPPRRPRGLSRPLTRARGPGRRRLRLRLSSPAPDAAQRLPDPSARAPRGTGTRVEEHIVGVLSAHESAPNRSPRPCAVVGPFAQGVSGVRARRRRSCPPQETRRRLVDAAVRPCARRLVVGAGRWWPTGAVVRRRRRRCAQDRLKDA